MNQKENLLDIIKLIWQKRKTILYACLIAVIGSSLITLLLPNIYRAETVFYAANPSLGNPTSMSQETEQINQYGSNRDLDRLFTIANSNELFHALNVKFNFFDHYNIDPNKPKANTKLRKKFKKYFNLLKTEYDAFSMSFEDTDPIFAAEVTNTARILLDEQAQSVVKSSQYSQITTYNNNIKQQQLQLSNLQDSLILLKNSYKIFNVEAQEEAMAELLTQTNFDLNNFTSKENYYRNIKKNRDSLRKYERLLYPTLESSKLIEEKIKSFNIGATSINSLDKEIRNMTSLLIINKAKLKLLTNTHQSSFKAIHLIEKAYIPDNKYSPKRSIYVLATTILTFIFTIMVIIVLHTFQTVNWDNILKD